MTCSTYTRGGVMDPTTACTDGFLNGCNHLLARIFGSGAGGNVYSVMNVGIIGVLSQEGITEETMGGCLKVCRAELGTPEN